MIWHILYTNKGTMIYASFRLMTGKIAFIYIQSVGKYCPIYLFAGVFLCSFQQYECTLQFVHNYRSVWFFMLLLAITIRVQRNFLTFGYGAIFSNHTLWKFSIIHLFILLSLAHRYCNKAGGEHSLSKNWFYWDELASFSAIFIFDKTSCSNNVISVIGTLAI